MSEYIIEIPDEYFASYDTERDMYYPDERDSAMRITPIVRCRDCKNFEPYGEPSDVYPDRYWCDKLTVYMPTDGFCSFGKRKEGGE